MSKKLLNGAFFAGLVFAGTARAEGQLLVSGEPGYSQPHVFHLVVCREAPAGGPERYSCAGERFQRALNVESPLAAGLYRLEYSGTYLFVKVPAEGVRRVRLGEVGAEGRSCLLDSALAGGTRFRVFRDFSDDGELRKEMLGHWSNAARERWTEGLCKLGHPNARPLCEVWSGSDPLRLRWMFGVANRNIATMDQLGRFGKAERRYVSSEVPCGERVAVLPGAYALENVTRGEVRTGFLVSAKGESYYAPPPRSLEVFGEAVSRAPRPQTLPVVSPRAAPRPIDIPPTP
jgi:hypothetical protein